ncbi:MAG: hypothetical protein ACYC6G_12780, partial [Desulfobaccales bacterium]
PSLLFFLGIFLSTPRHGAPDLILLALCRGKSSLTCFLNDYVKNFFLRGIVVGAIAVIGGSGQIVTDF